MDIQTEALVIDENIAGLTAAYKLVKAGKKVILVEDSSNMWNYLDNIHQKNRKK